MQQVANIDANGSTPGLVAFLCVWCGSTDSVLIHPIIIVEEPLGTMTNTETKNPFTYNDSCVKRDPHVAYSASSTHASEEAVKALLKDVFKLN
jgi:hypothetical protein